MSTTQTIGHGSSFEFDTTASSTPPAIGTPGGSDSWMTVAGVTSIDLGSDKVDSHDNTDMATTGTTRTFIPGLQNPGDISVKINVKPGDASQLALRALENDGLIHYFKAVYPAATETVSFAGFVTSIDETIPDDKIPTITVKLQVTGPKVRS